MNDTDAMHAAEAADPGFVHRNGWTQLACGRCREVLYEGRWISPEDSEELYRIHGTVCPQGGTP